MSSDASGEASAKDGLRRMERRTGASAGYAVPQVPRAPARGEPTSTTAGQKFHQAYAAEHLVHRDLQNGLSGKAQCPLSRIGHHPASRIKHPGSRFRLSGCGYFQVILGASRSGRRVYFRFE